MNNNYVVFFCRSNQLQYGRLNVENLVRIFYSVVKIGWRM